MAHGRDFQRAIDRLVADLTRFAERAIAKEIETNNLYGKLENASGADLAMRMNYDIHVGQIWGLPGKILAFCASLIVASLPVTGTLVWWGRKKKAKKPKRVMQPA